MTPLNGLDKFTDVERAGPPKITVVAKKDALVMLS
jgi:hypothetical protein